MKIFNKPQFFFLLALFFLVPINASVNSALLSSNAPPKYLSEFGFFEDMQNQMPSEEVHPYSLVNPLFSEVTDQVILISIDIELERLN